MADDIQGNGNGNMGGPRGNVLVMMSDGTMVSVAQQDAAKIAALASGRPVPTGNGTGQQLMTMGAVALTVSSLLVAVAMDGDAEDIRQARGRKFRKDQEVLSEMVKLSKELASAYAESSDEQDRIDRMQQESFALIMDLALLAAGVGGVALAVGGRNYSYEEFNRSGLSLAEVAIVGGFSAWVVSTWTDKNDRRRRSGRDDRDDRDRIRSLREYYQVKLAG